MNSQQGAPARKPATSDASDARLSGPWLTLARVGWVTFAALTLVLNAAGLPYVYARSSSVCTSDACINDPSRLTPERLQGLEELGLSPEIYAAYNVLVLVVVILVFAAVAAVIFWRSSDDRMALFGSFMLLVFGGAAITSDVPQALAAAHPALWFPVSFLNYLGQVSFTVFFYLFPNGRFVPRWTRWLALLTAVFWVPGAFFPDSSLNYMGGLVFFGLLVSLVGAQVYRYRRVSSSQERQQTKWVVFGVAVALLGFSGTVALGNLLVNQREAGPLTQMLAEACIYGFLLLIPLSIGVAILRSRLYEIDLLINRTLVYGALTISLALVYIGGVISLQYLLRTLTGQGSNLAVVASTLAIAALFQPLRRRFQGFIDRRFYRRKYSAAKTLAAFSARLRNETDLDTLGKHVLTVVNETMQPAHVSLWLRPSQEITSGKDVPPQEEKR